jgi:hypothetical protein
LELGRRLKTALDVLDEYKQTPRGPFITNVDFQGDRVRLGFSSGSKISAGEENPAGTAGESDQTANAISAAASTVVTARRNVETGSPAADKKPGARATPAAKPANNNRPRPR